MKTPSLFSGTVVSGSASTRLFARSLRLVAACVVVLLVAPNSWAQDGASLTDAAQKRTPSKDAKKPPQAKKKSADSKGSAKHGGHDHSNAPQFSLPKAKKPTGKKGDASTLAADGSAKESKNQAKKDWQSTCGKGSHAKGTVTSGVGSKPKAKPKAAGRVPKLVVEKLEISKEPVWYGEMIECEWVLKNEGDVNLSISARGG